MNTIAADTKIAPAARGKRDLYRTLFEWGGFIAGAVLVAFGVVAIVMGFGGRSTVADSLKAEHITGTPDMTPALIKKEAQQAHLNIATLDLPTASVAGKAIDTGTRARVFAQYMRIHALE